MQLLHAEHHQVLKRWLPLALLATLLCGLLYVSLQQVLRQEANDPQIQLAEDIAASLYQNQTPTANLTGSVDIEKSLAPFAILYNSLGKPVDGTGKLNGALPELPPGVLAYTEKHLENRLTWQPQPNIRVAAVIRYYQNDKQAGYVLAGRNLREVEHRTSQLLILAVIGWTATVLIPLALIILTRRRK